MEREHIELRFKPQHQHGYFSGKSMKHRMNANLKCENERDRKLIHVFAFHPTLVQVAFNESQGTSPETGNLDQRCGNNETIEDLVRRGYRVILSHTLANGDAGRCSVHRLEPGNKGK